MKEKGKRRKDKVAAAGGNRQLVEKAKAEKEAKAKGKNSGTVSRL